MKRFWTLLTLAAVLIVVAVSLGACDKKDPGPSPEPTPVATEVVPEPTAIPDPSTAVCFTPGAGAPGGGVCENADGAQVTCPADTSGLPLCD